MGSSLRRLSEAQKHITHTAAEERSITAYRQIKESSAKSYWICQLQLNRVITS